MVDFPFSLVETVLLMAEAVVLMALIVILLFVIASILSTVYGIAGMLEFGTSMEEEDSELNREYTLYTAKEAYAEGKITLEEFEETVEDTIELESFEDTVSKVKGPNYE